MYRKPLPMRQRGGKCGRNHVMATGSPLPKPLFFWEFQEGAFAPSSPLAGLRRNTSTPACFLFAGPL